MYPRRPAGQPLGSPVSQWTREGFTSATNGWLKFHRGGGERAEGELPEEVVLAGHRSEEGGLETLLATNLGSVESRP